MHKNLTITACTIEREKEIADLVKNNVEFFKQYHIRFTWPKRSVEEEYDPNIYHVFISRIENAWIDADEVCFSKILAFFHEPKDFHVTVEISQYGPLGFYDATRKTVTINLNTHLDPIDSIKHEFVHLMLNSFIKTYQIPQDQKENMVNVILAMIEGKK